MRKILFILIISVGVQAKFLEYSRSSESKKEFSFSEVCKSALGISVPMIKAANINQLDCMGQKVWVSSYCKQVSKTDPYWIRSYVDSDTNKVVCESARRVKIRYACKSGDELCSSAHLGCEFLKDSFAKSLSLNHSSFKVEVEGNKVMSCYFGPKKIKALSRK